MLNKSDAKSTLAPGKQLWPLETFSADLIPYFHDGFFFCAEKCNIQTPWKAIKDSNHSSADWSHVCVQDGEVVNISRQIWIFFLNHESFFCVKSYRGWNDGKTA